MLVGTIIIFVLGYISIALEQKIKIDKAATALVTGVACWMMYFLSSSSVIASENELMIQVGNISGLLFFLLGAMTIVELVDSHQGFNLITDAIHTPSKSKLLIIVAVTSFFLSSVLDNLTTAIVMASLCKKIIHDRKDRLWFLSMVIIAVNAGGAWSPLGDVTTTLLWIGGQITPVHIIGNTLIPCIAVTLFPLLILVRKFHGQKITVSRRERGMHSKEGKIILFTGIGLLLFVPVFKNLTHLPPWMGMLFALGMSWIVSNVIHYNKNPEIRSKFSVSEAIRKIDTSSILFFLGILLSISSLQTFGILTKLAGLTGLKAKEGPPGYEYGLVLDGVAKVE